MISTVMDSHNILDLLEMLNVLSSLDEQIDAITLNPYDLNRDDRINVIDLLSLLSELSLYYTR